jgi:outer membrane receptor protein involved in Fe transport
VLNLKLSLEKENLEIFTGINNLLNKEYSEYGSTNSGASVRALYPSPERNFFAGVKVKF